MGSIFPPRLASLLFASLLLAACAARSPLDTRAVDPALTPDRALANPEAARSRTVEWGGVIIGAANLEDSTRLEVLAYPLDHSGRPDLAEAPYGRFLALRRGYLETAIYSPGRLVTVVGPVTGTREGRVGEARYTYIVVSAEQLHLWPKAGRHRGPWFQFGIGATF